MPLERKIAEQESTAALRKTLIGNHAFWKLGDAPTLFVVLHSHSHEACPSRNGEHAARTFYRGLMEDVAGKAGVKLVGAYTAPTMHAHYLVLECDTYESLTKYLKPLYDIGKVEVVPVTQMQQRLRKIESHLDVVPADYYCMTCREDFVEDQKDAHKGHEVYTHRQMEEIWPHEYGGEMGGGA